SSVSSRSQRIFSRSQAKTQFTILEPNGLPYSSRRAAQVSHSRNRSDDAYFQSLFPASFTRSVGDWSNCFWHAAFLERSRASRGFSGRCDHVQPGGNA